MTEKLSEKEINKRMEEFSCWRREGEAMVRDVTCENFCKALALVNEIGAEAERFDHHPDILVHGWNKVRIILSTHSAGGLTENDFQLARVLEPLVAGYEKGK